MNFFQQQDLARKNTSLLVVLYMLAIATLIVLTSLMVIVVAISGSDADAPQINPDQLLGIFFHISLLVTGIVVVSSLYKIVSLRGGGARIAEMMEAKLIVSGTGDVNKQKVLNVVEEMALASGTPVPPVYLMDEPVINAFAAGYKPSDAVIGVTRGCIEQLSREQLQGVIAHEFSHILNGDMRLNIRLMGILHGILVIGLIGYWILRAGSGGSRREGNAGIALLGLGLIVIGFAGSFFGNLIKSSVSRQREYLADASAVQFTRDPGGIAGALKKIGGYENQSVLENPSANEISHAFFSAGVTNVLGKLSATHPPLADRIKRIDPSWDGEFEIAVAPEDTEQVAETDEPTEKSKKEKLAGILLATAGLQQLSLDDYVGNPTEQQLEQAKNILSEIPKALLEATHDPHGARALVHFLVLDEDEGLKQQQLQFLSEHAEQGVYDAVNKMVCDVSELPVEYRLPLIDLALPALRQLSQKQYALFHKNLSALIEMDAHVSLFEWIVQKIVFHHLGAVFEAQWLRNTKNTTLAKSEHSCSVLLSALAWSGEQNAISEQAAIDAASVHFRKIKIVLLTKESTGLQQLNTALDELAGLKPLEKSDLLQACAACITADKTVTTTESELLRAVAALIDCPMPPLALPEEIENRIESKQSKTASIARNDLLPESKQVKKRTAFRSVRWTFYGLFFLSFSTLLFFILKNQAPVEDSAAVVPVAVTCCENPTMKIESLFKLFAGNYETTQGFGLMKLLTVEPGTDDKSLKVKGNYAIDDGRLYGETRIDEPGSAFVVHGVWTETSSDTKCAEPKYGSDYWGNFTWEMEGALNIPVKAGDVEPRFSGFKGYWSYCDNPAIAGGNSREWRGRRVPPSTEP